MSARKFSTLYDQALLEAESSDCDNATVIQNLQKAAAEGDARATFALAQCYRYGSFGLAVDLRLAHDLNKSLEDSQIAEAVFNLALDYDLGNFVRRSAKKAFSLYMVAGLLGEPEACLQISRFYRHGEVVPQNRKLAKAWMERARCKQKDISPPYRIWIK